MEGGASGAGEVRDCCDDLMLSLFIAVCTSRAWEGVSKVRVVHFDWMLQVDQPQETTSLADLSRNASVISTSSSDDAQASPCIRPRRTFSAPRSKSPPQNPSFRPNDLSYSPMSKPRSKSRAREATTQDFKFGQTLGFGSYSEVRLSSPTPSI